MRPQESNMYLAKESRSQGMPSNLSSASYSPLNYLDLYTIFSEPPWGIYWLVLLLILFCMFFFLCQMSLLLSYHTISLIKPKFWSLSFALQANLVSQCPSDTHDKIQWQKQVKGERISLAHKPTTQSITVESQGGKNKSYHIHIQVQRE